MAPTICLLANAIGYPTGGGHLWVYLNWALGLRAAGCRVIWLEVVYPDMPTHQLGTNAGALKTRLDRYDLGGNLALCSWSGEPLLGGLTSNYLDLGAAAAEAHLLLNMHYAVNPGVVKRFQRSALVDIDPGLLQTWIARELIQVAGHDMYFTIGETVGQPWAAFPDGGLPWHYTPPCVALDWWPPYGSSADAPFTTISHWNTYDEWMEDAQGVYLNDKRAGFLPFLDLPRHTTHSLGLALCLSGDDDERTALQQQGWRVQEAWEVASTPWDYQHYIQHSRGEFSCVKPSCIRFQNAWVSDRTVCYLASGKPAVIEHTGSSRFLPDSAGLFRFRNLEEAARCLDTVAADYEHQCRLGRALAEEYFDARKVATRLLEQALA